MGISFNRIARSFRLTITSTSEDDIRTAASLLAELGFDVIVDEIVEGINDKPKKARSPYTFKPHWLYTFWRDGLLGYVGKTSRLEVRLKEHTNQLEFAQWILNGRESGDLSVSLREGLTFQEAKTLEARVIREQNPLFNVQYNSPLALPFDSGDKMKALLGE